MRIPLFLDGIGGGELFVILFFVLIFFGSKGLPGIARTMGRTMRQLRDASNDVQREIQREASQIQRSFDDQRSDIRIEPPRNAVPQSAPVAPAQEQPSELPAGDTAAPQDLPAP